MNSNAINSVKMYQIPFLTEIQSPPMATDLVSSLIKVIKIIKLKLEFFFATKKEKDDN